LLGTYNAGGEIDVSTAAELLAALRDLIDYSDEAIVSVDCSTLTFMDSAAFHALVDATEYAARRGHTLVVRNLTPACARLIRLCDFEHELRVTP
jgi:anti-anti-sigma factor